MFAMRGIADGPKAKAKDIAKDPSGVFNSAREELKNVGGDLAKTIAGNVSRDVPVDEKDVTSVTRECESLDLRLTAMGSECMDCSGRKL